MSTSYHAHAFYGYSFPKADLTQRVPNPLWGKVKFDPNTGVKVTQFVETDIELDLEEGDNHPKMESFVRFDTGYDDDAMVILGVQLAEMDLSYGSRDPRSIELLNDDDLLAVATLVRDILNKAKLPFNPAQMGYWLGGYAG